jgi:crotonobetainyl-CoA:carnitine CoA-transferase CaiB-like acyl-CoA transferase
VQPGLAPRFSATPAEVAAPPRVPGSDTVPALVDWGIDRDRIEALVAAGVLTVARGDANSDN